MSKFIKERQHHRYKCVFVFSLYDIGYLTTCFTCRGIIFLNFQLEYNCKPGTLKGDNFLGDLGSVELSAKVWSHGQSQPEEKSYHWMVKMLKPDPRKGVPNMGRMIGAFDREMRIYRDVLPALKEVIFYILSIEGWNVRNIF